MVWKSLLRCSTTIGALVVAYCSSVCYIDSSSGHSKAKRALQLPLFDRVTYASMARMRRRGRWSPPLVVPSSPSPSGFPPSSPSSNGHTCLLCRPTPSPYVLSVLSLSLSLLSPPSPSLSPSSPSPARSPRHVPPPGGNGQGKAPAIGSSSLCLPLCLLCAWCTLRVG